MRGRTNGPVLTVLLLAIVLGGPAVEAELVEAIAARVGGGLITESEVREAMAPLAVKAAEEYSGQRLQRELIRIRSQVLDLLIDEELIIQHGKTIDARVSEREVDAAEADIMARNDLRDLAQLEAALASEGRTRESLRRDLKRQLLVMQIRGMELAKEVRITDGAIREYYQEHASEFQVPDTVDLGLIVVPLPEAAEEAGALREEMGRLVADLRSGTADFADAAREHSTDPSGLTGGSLGRLQRGSLRPEIEEVIFSMEAGQVSDPLELDGRLYIMEVRDRVVGGAIPLAEVKDRIAGRLAREKEERASRQWLEELRAKAFIEKRYE